MVGKYQAYPEYKDSGSKWVGEIPSNWEAIPLKHILSMPITDGPHSTPVFIDDGVPFVSAEAVSGGYIDFNKIRGFISEADDEFFSQKYRPKKNDVYMIKSGATTGISAIVETDCRFNIWSPLAVMRCKETYSPCFLLNYIRSDSFQKSVQLSWTFGTQQNIGMGTLENLTVCCPPLYEQQVIANFLDHETTKIDTLIDKQQQLIQLLKEKRQAVISHAVTKGLNPNAPMRDSGVEWLGEVPEHWDVVPIKHIVSIPVTDGPHETPVFYDEGVPFISAEAVSTGKINFDKKRAHISEEDNAKYSLKYSPKKHDIYMVKSGATTGVTAIVETNDKFNIWSPLAVIRCKKDSYPYFILNFMRSSNFLEAVELNWSFGTQQNIGMGVIENLHVTRPPIEEAKLIVDKLNDQIDTFNFIIDKAELAINLMQERRTALISAAVTGKMDVRHDASHPVGGLQSSKSAVRADL